MEEMLDTFDINGNFLGVKPRSFCHSENPGVYHKAIWLWLINNKGEVLIQKRAVSKKKNPGKWDISVAGHVGAGETCIQTLLRETKEELGIKLNCENISFQCQLINHKGWSLEEIYIATIFNQINDMTLQPEEVEEVKWVKFNEFVKLLYSDEFVPHEKQFKDKFCEIIQNFN